MNAFERFGPRVRCCFFVSILACSTGYGTSLISTNVSAQPIGGPAVTQGTGTPGQILTDSIAGGQSFAQAVTDYGVNKAQISSSDYRNSASASSDWLIGFTLSGPPNTFVPLSISYSYDFSLTAFAGFGSPSTGYYLSATYGIAGNGPSQGNPYDVFVVNATSDADGSLEICKSKIPGAATPQQCLGSYAGSGIVTPLNNFHTGHNGLEGVLTVTGDLGAIDAYNTAVVTGILVPDGFTWTYDGNITGNPLNFHFASTAAVPEPATFAMLGAGLMALGTSRLLRKGPWMR